MIKLFKIIKINNISYFNFYKILNAKNTQDRVKEILKFICFVLVFFSFGVLAFFYAKMSMDGYKALGIEYILLGQFFAIVSLFSLFTTIFKVDGTLFNSKDIDLLMSLPLKKSTIIASKVLDLYISNLLFTLVIMIPVLIVYTLNCSFSFLFLLLYIISMFLIPMIPTIIAIIIGTCLTFISTRFKIKKVIQLLSSILILVISLYLSYLSSKIESFDFVNLGKSMMNILNKIYPLTNAYIKMLIDNNLTAIIIFFILPIILFFLIIKLISLFYTNIINKVNNRVKKKSYHLVKEKAKSPFKALFIKEVKRYISSPNYVMNTSLLLILLLVSSIALIFVNPSKIEQILAIEGLKDLIVNRGPILIGFILMISCTTCSSISLEGKNLWIIKSIPIATKEIFYSKILLNLFLLLIPSFIVSIILSIVLDLSFKAFMLFIITALVYSGFISILGLIINIYFPLLNWKNEVRVIKQSMATFITSFLGAILGIAPLFIKTGLNNTVYLLLIDLVILVLDIVLLIFLNTKGIRKFRQIEA